PNTPMNPRLDCGSVILFNDSSSTLRGEADLDAPSFTSMRSRHPRKRRIAFGTPGTHTQARSQISRRHILAEVRLFDGESIESALRRFKRQVQQEGIIKEVKKHSFFLKPGEKKRLKSKLAQKLKRKKVRRQPADSDSKTAPRSNQ